MKFTVKTLEGKSQEFDLPGELTVAELKLKVEEALGTPHATQRMIIQGKVLKDEEQLLSYDIEGKTIHVVKNAPSLQTSAPPPHVPVELRPQKLSQEFLYVGITPETLPPPPEVIYLQDTAKDSADNILNTVTTGGHPNALVTVTIHTLSPDGRPIKSSTHTSTSYKPGDACLEDAPHPDPAIAEEELRKKKQKEEERQARRDRLARYRERVKEQQRRGREQTNILEIYQHMTSVRRAIQGAENILEDYLNSQEFKDAKEVLEHHLKLKAESEAKMEATEQGSIEEGTTAKEKVDDTEGATPKDAATRKDAPQYAMGEDGRPRQHILTDTGMLLPAGAHLYAALIDDIMTLQRRGLELHEFYARKIYAEEHYEIEDNRCNSKLVTAIQRYHNAMGQAYASLKRVQVTLEGEPPRIVNLTPMPRAANPLLSLLSQPLGSDSDNEETSGRGDEEGGSQSIAGLLGSLMATRAAISMMEQEEENQRSETSTTQPSETAPATTGGSEGATEEKKEEPKEPEKEDEDEDDDEINPFLPGPVHLLQQMIRQRQERERQQQQERTVYIQHDQSFFETIARIRQAVGGPEEEIMPPTLIGHLVEKCMRKLSISEVVTVFGGTTTPLKSIHPTLREFVQEKLLDGAEPTNDNIPEAIAKFVEDLPGVLNEMDPPLPLRTDVDFGLSAQKCCSHMLQEALDLIVNKPDDDPDFAEAIHKWAMNIGTLFTLVLRESLLSANDLTPSLKRISKMMFPDNDTPGVLSMLNSQSLVDKFVDESEKSTLTIEEIVCYLVMKPDAEQMEVDPPQEGSENIEGHGQEVKTTQSWPEAMPKDWIPTIEQDQIEMAKTTVQPPLSTAYLSGMPSKKRKQLESGETESVHISEVLGESLESAIQTSGAAPTSGATTEDIVREAKQNKDLVQGMGEEFHSSVKDRLQQDPNYDPAKYPSAQKFYQPANTK